MRPKAIGLGRNHALNPPTGQRSIRKLCSFVIKSSPSDGKENLVSPSGTPHSHLTILSLAHSKACRAYLLNSSQALVVIIDVSLCIS